MRTLTAACALIGITCMFPALAAAQSTPSPPPTSVPRVITIKGTLNGAEASRASRIETVTLAIYAEEQGGASLWQETQNVIVQPTGAYTILLGASESEGVPMHVFVSGEARYVGLTWLRKGPGEEPRIQLTSVPYALRAADADTLGGRPASAYQLAPEAGAARSTTTALASDAPSAIIPGTPNYLAKFITGEDVGISSLYETGGRLGINTTTPLDMIHSRFTNDTGALTGLVVQNLSGAAGAYSGMLFRDHTNAVGMFQGFNNSTKEYRINNVAAGGQINFMTAGVTRLKIHDSGTVMLNATALDANTWGNGRLEVRNDSGIGILARKTTTGESNNAIVARSLPGLNGAVIKGLAGTSDNTDNIAQAAIIAVNGNANGIGIQVVAGATGSVAVRAFGPTAGEFNGNVSVSGTLTKGGGAFQIDHPLDPENKYLQHSFVESPDMMNIYNGNVTLDAQGNATVALPAWFEPLNRDFRYQLTPVGAPGPNLYVAQKVSGNQFTIAGGTPNGEVSWQVTGIRQDAWANANRIQVETPKPPASAPAIAGSRGDGMVTRRDEQK
jgi:hypothetical protein